MVGYLGKQSAPGEASPGPGYQGGVGGLSVDVADRLEMSHRWMKLWRSSRLIMPRKKLPRRWALLLLLPLRQGKTVCLAIFVFCNGFDS